MNYIIYKLYIHSLKKPLKCPPMSLLQICVLQLSVRADNIVFVQHSNNISRFDSTSSDGSFAALVMYPAAKPPVSHSCDTIAVFALFLWSQHRWAGQLGGAELYLRIPHRCRPQPKLSEVISENCILSLSRPDAAPILFSSEWDTYSLGPQ